MIDPFSAATLGGLAYDTAKTAITKWVGARIAAGLDSALRDRQLMRGRPAKDQQIELAAVITAAVELTADEQFPGEERLQGLFRKALLDSSSQDWPLVNGSDLTDIVHDIHAWISENDPQPGSSHDTNDPATHPYLLVLCRNIIAQFGFRAENNGARNTILYPRWSRFWTTELFTNYVPQARSAPGDPNPSASWPRRIGTIPPLAAAWQHRPVNEKLTAALAAGGTAVVCQILSGMGGVGKTQVGAAYAHQRWNQREVDLLIWVNATARDSITATFAQAGSELCGADTADSDRAAHAFLNWLDRPDTPRWLIVLDDLTDPADLHRLWPPTAERGRTIVTTRRRDAALDGDRRTRIHVDLYTPDQALAYLTDRLGGDPRLLDGATDLARDLGHLPLALAQAAAYILDQPGQTCATYRDLLAAQTLTLEQLSPETLPEDYPRTVAAALNLAIDHADRYEPIGLASHLLAIGSLLDPAGIPADLFTAIRSATDANENPTTDSSGDTEATEPTPRAVTDTLARLHRRNLIDHDGATIRIHALVQRARRDQLDADALKRTATLAAAALDRIWPDVKNAPAYSATLRANVARLRQHAETVLIQDQAHPILFRQGTSLGEHGLVTDARDHFEHLQRLCEQSLGPDHRHTLAARVNFADWRGQAGDPAGAAIALEALLADDLRIFGPDHPDTLRTRNNLAAYRGKAGNVAAAVADFEQLLTDDLRVFGPGHPHTLTTQGNLANWRGEAGDVTGAIAEYEALLSDQLRIFGPDHPDTLRTRNNLASFIGDYGGSAEAAAAFETLLTDQLRVLGPDHPMTLGTRANLAAYRGEAGDAAAAVADFEQVLTDRLRVLGADHPDTLTTRHQLARWRVQAGDMAGAATEFETLVTDQLRVLGPDHPDAFATRHELASFLGSVGYVAGAVAAFEALLTDLIRVLGPDHPRTLLARNNLAAWQVQAGDVAGAIAAFEVLLADRLRVLGPDHPDVEVTRSNLEFCRARAVSEDCTDQ